MQNHSNENEIDLHENEHVGGTHFHMNGFGGKRDLKNGLLTWMSNIKDVCCKARMHYLVLAGVYGRHFVQCCCWAHVPAIQHAASKVDHMKLVRQSQTVQNAIDSSGTVVTVPEPLPGSLSVC